MLFEAGPRYSVKEKVTGSADAIEQNSVRIKRYEKQTLKKNVFLMTSSFRHVRK